MAATGPTTSASLGDSLQYIEDEARMVREYGTVMTRLVDKRSLPLNTGRTWDEISISRLNPAQSIDEDTDLENFQQFVDTLFSVEPVMVGIATFITDKAKDIVSTKTLAETGQGMQNHPKYLWIFCIKLILVLCLLTLFLYTVIFKSDQDEEEEGENYESIPFQRAALWMGFFIILCAAAMKHLHQ